MDQEGFWAGLLVIGFTSRQKREKRRTTMTVMCKRCLWRQEIYTSEGDKMKDVTSLGDTCFLMAWNIIGMYYGTPNKLMYFDWRLEVLSGSALQRDAIWYDVRCRWYDTPMQLWYKMIRWNGHTLKYVQNMKWKFKKFEMMYCDDLVKTKSKWLLSQ